MGKVLKRLSLHASAIIGLYAGGATFEELAEQYQCCPQTIRRFLIVSDVPLYPKPRQAKLQRFESELIVAYLRGEKISRLASRYGVSAPTVRKFLTIRLRSN